MSSPVDARLNTLAIDGLLLTASVGVGFLSSFQGLPGAAAAVGIFYTGNRLISALNQGGRVPTISKVASGIWNYISPQPSFPIGRYKEKLWSLIVGGALGFAVSKIPYFEQQTGVGPWTLTPLVALGSYFYADLKQGTARVVGAASPDGSEEVPPYMSADAERFVTTRLTKPIPFQDASGRTINIFTIKEAIQQYLRYVRNDPGEAVETVLDIVSRAQGFSGHGRHRGILEEVYRMAYAMQADAAKYWSSSRWF